MTTADHLFEMRAEKRRVASLPNDAIPGTLAEAYREQDSLVRRLLAQSGGHPIGYKIAGTNRVAQELLKVDAPFFGILLSHSTFRSPATLPAADFTVRCVEPEFGIEIGADVPESATPYTADSIAKYVAAVIPSIEIVDHRFFDWAAVGAPSLAADNAIHGAWVEGIPVADWRGTDLSSHTVTLFVNGEELRTGTGAAVLGHPLNVVAWLADELPRHGRKLRRGDKISTGVVMPVYLAEPGDRIAVDFGHLGRVELSFTR